MALLLTPAYWLCAVLLAALAVCWAYVLVQPGMLLAPAQAWVRTKWREWGQRVVQKEVFSKGSLTQEQQATFFATYPDEIDSHWWFKLSWGCYACVSGQAGFWGYLLLFPLASYSLLAHLGFAAITLLFAAIWRAVYAWSQSL